MNYRSLGRTGLEVSVIGYGTAQLRLVPEKQAISSLERAFDLGINIVHVAPDYECAERYVASAIAANPGIKVYVCSQGWGTAAYLESQFELSCRNLRSDYIDLYGLASVYDLEKMGCNVWGKNGLIEFLLKKREEGRIGHIFCTTHGPPEHTREIIESGVFDALMIAYNDLGFYAYSQDRRTLWSFTDPPENVDTDFEPENLMRNKHEVFPVAERLGVGLMIMKPFAAGHLVRSKSFPPRIDSFHPDERVGARETLRSILMNRAVSCVVPGMASVVEVEANAAAGSGKILLSEREALSLGFKISEMKAQLCSSCGDCNPRCSQSLPVSWLFRAGYIAQYPSAIGESWNDVEYFTLHPSETSVCSQCPDVTCSCPEGIDIQSALTRIHQTMVQLDAKGVIARPSRQKTIMSDDGAYGARVILKEFPASATRGSETEARIFVENAGPGIWRGKDSLVRPGLKFGIFVDEKLRQAVPLHRDVPPNDRTCITVAFAVPKKRGSHPVTVALMKRRGFVFKQKVIELAEAIIDVT